MFHNSVSKVLRGSPCYAYLECVLSITLHLCVQGAREIYANVVEFLHTMQYNPTSKTTRKETSVKGLNIRLPSSTKNVGL